MSKIFLWDEQCRDSKHPDKPIEEKPEDKETFLSHIELSIPENLLHASYLMCSMMFNKQTNCTIDNRNYASPK